MKAMAKNLSFLTGLALAVLALAMPTRGEVVATAKSPEGAFPAFRVVLDAVGEPVAVANFVGLVDGSQRWSDPETWQIRGGMGDAFYDGMVFDLSEGNEVHGGLKEVEVDGERKYSGGPGYTVLGKTDEAWSDVEWGAMALAETRGPHSGGSDVALFLTNSMTPWTVFGKVRSGDEAGAKGLAEAVASHGPTEVRWEVDSSRATEEERSALEAGRGKLPAVGGLDVRVSDGGGGFEFVWPAHTYLVVRTGTDMMAGLRGTVDGWHETPEAIPMALGWEDMGLSGPRGFVGLTGVGYPGWSAEMLQGKWRMVMEHNGQEVRYWFDFDGRTGRVERVVGGEVVEQARVTGLEGQRETGNSWRVFFALGLRGTYYYLGFAEEGARRGRFMSLQLPGDTDWGMFTMKEGWGETVAGTRSRGGTAGMWREEGFALPRRSGSEGRRDFQPIRKARTRGTWKTDESGRRTSGTSGGEKKLGVGVFGEGNPVAEEGDALFDGGEVGGGRGSGGGTEAVGEGGFDFDGFVETAGKGQGDGEGVANHGVAGSGVAGLAGDVEDFIGGGGGGGGRCEEPGEIGE